MRNLRAMALVLSFLTLAACGLNLMPIRDPFYSEHYFIMQDYEREVYRSLTPNGRLEFQNGFWASRLPSAKLEFDNRMSYIKEKFRTENSSQPWNTDRARVYLLNGSPAAIEFKPNDAWGITGGSGGGGVASAGDRSNEDIQASTLEVWSYPYDKYVVMYGFVFAPGNKWKAAIMSAGGARFIGELEMKNKIEIWGPTDEDVYRAKLEALKSIK